MSCELNKWIYEINTPQNNSFIREKVIQTQLAAGDSQPLAVVLLPIIPSCCHPAGSSVVTWLVNFNKVSERLAGREKSVFLSYYEHGYFSYTCFGEVHASYDRLWLPIHVHEGCVHLVVPPVQESLHHVQTLLGVSSTTERHGSQYGHRPFSWRRRHVSTSRTPWQTYEHVFNIVTLSECAQSCFYYPQHAKVQQRACGGQRSRWRL